MSSDKAFDDKAVLLKITSQDALKDLLSLAALAADEWNVQFLLGKTYGALGQHTQMIKHFTFAQDLDPRSAQRYAILIFLQLITDLDAVLLSMCAQDSGNDRSFGYSKQCHRQRDHSW